MPWLLLVVAGLLEVVWAIGLKLSEGFTKPFPGAITIVAMLASFYLLSRALVVLPVGTGYAVWTGIGAAGAAIVGMAWLGEPASLARGLCVLLIIGGIVGLRIAG